MASAQWQAKLRLVVLLQTLVSSRPVAKELLTAWGTAWSQGQDDMFAALAVTCDSTQLSLRDKAKKVRDDDDVHVSCVAYG